MNVVLIDYGAGNTKSVQNALKKISVVSHLSSDPKDLYAADAVILPGVGHFGSAMKKLADFKKPLQEYVETGKPFLGVCLGIQIIFEKSPEAEGVSGLELLKGTCAKFNASKILKVPHMGWNTLNIKNPSPLLEGITSSDYFYFVHSYYPIPADENAICATTNYGVEFTSIVSKNNVHATQFHPERSGEKGLKILENFIELGKK